MKPRNSGLGLPGRDLNSGWNCGGASGGAWCQVGMVVTAIPPTLKATVFIRRIICCHAETAVQLTGWW